MHNFTKKINRRLLTVILSISILLAVGVATVIMSEKDWFVRVIDNVFLGAILNLLFMMFFRMRAGHEEQAYKETVQQRKKGKIKKEDRKKLSRYDTFRLFTTHFGWSSLVMFVLAGLGTVVYTLTK